MIPTHDSVALQRSKRSQCRLRALHLYHHDCAIERHHRRGGHLEQLVVVSENRGQSIASDFGIEFSSFPCWESFYTNNEQGYTESTGPRPFSE